VTVNRLLIVTNSVSGGGAENSMFALHKELLTRGVASKIVALNVDGRSRLETDDIIELGRKWKSGPFQTIAALREFRRVVHHENPETIILNCELPELYGALTSACKCKFIAVEHTTKPWYKRRALGIVTRIALRVRGSKWVTVNSINQRIWPIGQRATYIANPINVPVIEQSHAGLKSLVYVGRLRPEKRVEWAIELASELNLPLDIYGEGLHLSALEELSEKVGAKVKFHGYQENIWEEIGNGQLVIIPSEFEGDGIVVLEALARDCPVLLADNADLRRFGLPELNYGANAKDMANKIKNNSFNEFYVSKKSRKELLQNRRIETIAERWMQVINS